MVLISDIFRGI